MICTSIFILLGVVLVIAGILLWRKASEFMNKPLPDWVGPLSVIEYTEFIEEQSGPLVGCISVVLFLFGIAFLLIAGLRAITLT